MTTESFPPDSIFYRLGDIPVAVIPGKDPVAIYNKTTAHGAEETVEVVQRPLTTAEQAQLFKLPQLSREGFGNLTPPPWVEAQGKSLPRWVAWLKAKAANFKAKASAAPKSKEAPKPKEDEDDGDNLSDMDEVEGQSEKSWMPRFTLKSILAIAILSLFAIAAYSLVPGCSKKKTAKPAAVAKSAPKKAAAVEDDFMGAKPAKSRVQEDDFMGGQPAPKPAPKSTITHASDSTPAGFVDGGRPSCTQTENGIVWSSNERKLPLVMRSDVAYIASLTASQNTGYVFVNMRSGSVVVIGTKINLPLLTPEEMLAKLPMPNALAAAVKAASAWRFADTDRGAATRKVELVCNTGSAINPQRILAQGGIMIWPHTTLSTSGCAFALGLPAYKSFPCMTDSFARPHSPGESENRLASEVKYVGEIASRMVVKDMQLAGKSGR